MITWFGVLFYFNFSTKEYDFIKLLTNYET